MSQQQYGTSTGQTQGSTQQQQFQPGGTQGGQLPQQYRQVLGEVAQAVQVCGWCADQCIQQADPGMVECVRLCEDVVEIGETLLAVAPRSSRFTADLARTFTQAAQACAQECGRHHDAHCQECAAVLPQAARTVQQLGTQGATGGQPPEPGTTGQQFGTGQQLSM